MLGRLGFPVLGNRYHVDTLPTRQASAFHGNVAGQTGPSSVFSGNLRAKDQQKLLGELSLRPVPGSCLSRFFLGIEDQTK